jgi:hypothetical protein
MSAVRLYVDEDAEQRALVSGLRARGVDVVTAWETNMVGRSDEQQLEYAIEQQRTIYTLNVGDFSRLHQEHLAAGREHFGIIVIPGQRYAVGEKTRRLAAVVEAKTAEEMRNRIEFL